MKRLALLSALLLTTCATCAIYDGGGESIPETCGNGVVDTNQAVSTVFEECDLPDMDGQTCQTLGFVGGDLSCTPTCRFDTTECRER